MSEEAKSAKKGRTSAKSAFNRSLRALNKYLNDNEEEGLISNLLEEVKSFRHTLCEKNDAYVSCFDSDSEEITKADEYIEEVELEYRTVEAKVFKYLSRIRAQQDAVKHEREVAERAFVFEQQKAEAKRKMRVLGSLRRAEMESLKF